MKLLVYCPRKDWTSIGVQFGLCRPLVWASGLLVEPLPLVAARIAAFSVRASRDQREGLSAQYKAMLINASRNAEHPLEVGRGFKRQLLERNPANLRNHYCRVDDKGRF